MKNTPLVWVWIVCVVAVPGARTAVAQATRPAWPEVPTSAGRSSPS